MRLRRLPCLAVLAVLALAPAAVFAQFNQTPLISTSLGGIVSGTNMYGRNVSGTVGMFGSIGSGLINTTGISVTTNQTSVTSLYVSGNVGIGTTSPNARLAVNGTISSTGLGVAGAVSAYTIYAATIGLGIAPPSLPGGVPVLNIVADTSTFPLLNLTNTNAAGYTYLTVSGTARIFGTGVGNDSESLFGVANKYFVYDATSGAMRMVIDTSGNVGIATAAPSYKLHVNGSVAGVGAYNALSDRRFKRDIQPAEYGLATVEKLRPVTFDWINPTSPQLRGRQLGLIAQEVRPLVPEAVSVANDPSHTMSIAYGTLVPVLIKAVQELKADNGSLRTEFEAYRRSHP